MPENGMLAKQQSRDGACARCSARWARHQDVGQMDMYVRMYDERVRGEGDNPTLGIVLCSETDEDIARYSILHDSDQLFAAKYAPYLPSEDELRAEIEAQKHFFALQQQEAKSEEGLA